MASDKFSRDLVLEDKQLFEMVQEKGRMVEEGRAIAAELERLAKEHEKVNNRMSMLGAKLNRHKVKIIARVQKLAKDQIAEFEMPVTTEIRDGVLYLQVSDALAEFKDNFANFDKFKEAMPRKKK